MRRGQSTIEYILVIGVLAVSLVVMGVYIKRGFQGNIRGLADQTGEQYSPGHMTININENMTLNSNESSNSLTSDGSLMVQNSHSIQGQMLDRYTSEGIEALNEE